MSSQKKPLLGKEAGRFLSLFFVVFLAVFAAVNLLDAYFRLDTAVELPSFYQKNGISNQEDPSIPSCQKTDKTDSIFIPSLEVNAPLVFPDITESPGFEASLKKGVIVYPQWSLPGEKGIVMILGHSAPMGWPRINYDWVFSDLHQLKNKDAIHLFYKGCRYDYFVSGQYVLEKGGELPQEIYESPGSVAVLVSCWPPGRDLKRIAIVALLNEGD